MNDGDLQATNPVVRAFLAQIAFLRPLLAPVEQQGMEAFAEQFRRVDGLLDETETLELEFVTFCERAGLRVQFSLMLYTHCAVHAMCEDLEEIEDCVQAHSLRGEGAMSSLEGRAPAVFEYVRGVAVACVLSSLGAGRLREVLDRLFHRQSHRALVEFADSLRKSRNWQEFARALDRYLGGSEVADGMWQRVDEAVRRSMIGIESGQHEVVRRVGVAHAAIWKLRPPGH